MEAYFQHQKRASAQINVPYLPMSVYRELAVWQAHGHNPTLTPETRALLLATKGIRLAERPRTLYRGVTIVQGESLPNSSGATVEYKVDSSWTPDLAVARRFAKMPRTTRQGKSKKVRTTAGCVLQLTLTDIDKIMVELFEVSIDMLQMAHGEIMNQLVLGGVEDGENEVILVPGAYECQVLETYQVVVQQPRSAPLFSVSAAPK